MGSEESSSNTDSLGRQSQGRMPAPERGTGATRAGWAGAGVSHWGVQPAHDFRG